MSFDPFLIEGPAHVSTSGGLTSGLMLRRVLDAHGGELPADVHALFCNTGKERPETLDFVHEIETRWNVPIVWLEYVAPDWPEGPLLQFWVDKNGRSRFGFYHDEDDARNDGAFRVVTYETASRKGEPFDALLRHRARINRLSRGTLPNQVSAWCSSELKQRTMRRWMVAQGYDEWTSVVGLRADERRRVARMNGRKLERGWVEMPLAAAGISVDDVRAFWAVQPFTLRLRPYEGNCDLCFKKGRAKLERIIRERPESADWWVEKEEATGALWHDGRPSVKRLRVLATTQCALPIDIDEEDEDALPCTCTD